MNSNEETFETNRLLLAGDSLGQYPGTYSFAADEDGTDPDEWTLDESSGTISVISGIGEHNKVVELYDDNDGDYLELYNDFTGQASGTIEFWVRGSDVTESFYIRGMEGANYRITLRISLDKCQYYTTSWHDITDADVLDDNWYHLKLVFDCDTDTLDFYLDGLWKQNIPFESGANSINKFYFQTLIPDRFFYYYIDAIGYSWDPNYNVGDNRRSSAVSKSHYPGTYSFAADEDGTDPDEWTLDEGGGSVNVIASLVGHDKIVELDDVNTNDVWLYNTFTGRTSGTIEYWVRATDNTKRVNLRVMDTAHTAGIWFLIDDGGFQYYNGGFNIIQSCNNNQWYHIKIEFDTTDWHLWIDEVSKDGGSGYSFYNSPTIFEELVISTGASDSTFKAYIDAVGYSWDPNYNIGDNLIPYWISNLIQEMSGNIASEITTRIGTDIVEDIIENMVINIATSILNP